MKTYWPSPAKLNLFLYITGKRYDGYHTLQTLFQFLNYNETIIIKPRQDGQIRLLTPIIGVDNKNNLIIRAANLLMKKAILSNRLLIGSNGADIYVKKKLPIGGGLGSASTNAATTIVALNYLWNCKFTEDELASLGLFLGADVPVFIRGYAAIAEGIGEIFFPIQPKEKWYLVVYPKIFISTSLIFKDPELPRNTPKRSIENLLKSDFSNDFEKIVRKRFHEVDVAISWLSNYAPSRLTGTGSCVFAEFNNKSDAYYVLKKAPDLFNCFVAQGINISPLRNAITKIKNLFS